MSPLSLLINLMRPCNKMLKMLKYLSNPKLLNGSVYNKTCYILMYISYIHHQKINDSRTDQSRSGYLKPKRVIFLSHRLLLLHLPPIVLLK